MDWILAVFCMTLALGLNEYLRGAFKLLATERLWGVSVWKNSHSHKEHSNALLPEDFRTFELAKV